MTLSIEATFLVKVLIQDFNHPVKAVILHLASIPDLHNPVRVLVNLLVLAVRLVLVRNVLLQFNLAIL